MKAIFGYEKCLVYLMISIAGMSAARADEFTADIDVPYEQISFLHRAIYKDAMAAAVAISDCQLVGTPADPRAPGKQYRCGEVPLGTIDGDRLKRILKIDVPEQSGKRDGVKYSISRGSFDVSLSRVQRRSVRQINELTANAIVETEMSRALGRDVYLRLNPQNDLLSTQLCLVVPGLTIDSSPVEVDGDMEKEIFFFPDIHADLDIKIDLGRGGFESAMVCGDFTTVMNDQGFQKMTLNKISSSKTAGIYHVGLKVKVDADIGGFWGFINGITSAFGFDLEKIIAAKIKEKVVAEANEQIDVSLESVRNGSWVNKYLDVAAIKKAVTRLSNQVEAQLNSLGDGERLEDRILQASCARATDASGLSPALKKTFYRLCTQTAELDLTYFANNAKSRDAGCYTRSFNPRKLFYTDSGGARIKSWWGTGCVMTTRARVKVNSHIAPLTQCLLESWKEARDPALNCALAIETLRDRIRDGELQVLISTLKPGAFKPDSAEELLMMSAIFFNKTGVSVPLQSPDYDFW